MPRADQVPAHVVRALRLSLRPRLPGGDRDWRSGRDEDANEQDEAHRAVQGGAIRPLSEILARLPRGAAGEIVRVKLKKIEEKWVYELRRVDCRGLLSEIVVDATTGAEISEDGD